MLHDASALFLRNRGEMDTECFGVVGSLFDIALGSFSSVEKLSLPFSIWAIGLVYAETDLVVVFDLGDFHTCLLLGAFWCLWVPGKASEVDRKGPKWEQAGAVGKRLQMLAFTRQTLALEGKKEWCPRQDLNLYDVTH